MRGVSFLRTASVFPEHQRLVQKIGPNHLGNWRSLGFQLREYAPGSEYDRRKKTRNSRFHAICMIKEAQAGGNLPQGNGSADVFVCALLYTFQEERFYRGRGARRANSSEKLSMSVR
jgi:hypothetical protein